MTAIEDGRLAFVTGGLPGLPQRRDHHGEVVVQVVGATVPIPIRRERLDELAEDHQHCRSVHAAIDRDRARLHCLVNYRGDLDHSVKRVLALHNATGARNLGSLPICVQDQEAPHRGVQALIGGNWLAHADHSNPWRATPDGRSIRGSLGSGTVQPVLCPQRSVGCFAQRPV
jgi:hypothetical protein